ncbi:MAG: efflux transporter periplasmic adaptor subunit [Bacteroidetes bacterium]|nr:efflux transporter periplasmic adaptor subunit [Bacteroidota bacterium]
MIAEKKPVAEVILGGMDRRVEKRFWTARNIGLAVLGGFVLIVLGYLFFFMDGSSRLHVEAQRLTISTVTRGAFQEFTPVSGSILPRETFFLDAVDGGRVECRYVEAGATLKQGDPILKLNNANLQLDVMYREALSYEQINNARLTRIAIEQNSIAVRGQVADVLYQLERAARAYRRDSLLAMKGMVSDLEFKQTKDDYAYWLRRREIARESAEQDSLLRVQQLGQLNASVKRLQANLDMIKRNLDALVVRAPISGQLSSLNVEIGQSTKPGERLGQIDVLGSYKVRAGIDEYYLSRVRIGQPGAFEFSGQDHSVTVSKIYPEVREGKFEVDMEFAQTPPEGIRRGQTVQVRLTMGDTAEATLIPRGAFYQNTGGRWVYVVDKSGAMAVKRAVTLGRQNPMVIEVLAGLEPGEQVVTSSYDTFADIDKLVLQ